MPNPKDDKLFDEEKASRLIMLPGIMGHRAAVWGAKKAFQAVTHKSNEDMKAAGERFDEKLESIGGWIGDQLYKIKEFDPTNPKQQQQQQPQQFAGVFFGVRNRALIEKPLDADGHVLVVGGAGSGKSSCIAIPTLRDAWTAPALVVDIKGELYAKSKRPHAAVFNPLDPNSLGYDPFYALRDATNPATEIRDIALTLCPMSGEIRDPFWIQAAQNILTGHLLYCYKQGETFTEALRILQSTTPAALFDVEKEDAEASMYLTQYVGLKHETLSGIMAELSNKVMPFATDPHIQATLTKQDIITPKLLEQGYDIFLQLPEYKLEQWKPMISLIVQQFARHFEKRPDEGATPILFMLDEFPRLGKMETVVHGLATLRSKHITIMPVVQSLAQLDAIYGHDERKVIADNCSYKAILGATDADSQAYFSKLVGTEEREKISTNYEGKAPGSGWLADYFSGDVTSSSKTTEEKAIIRPEEFAYLKDIVLLTPRGWFRVQKVPYYLGEQTQPVMQVVNAQPAPPPRPTEGTPARSVASMPSAQGEQQQDTASRYEAVLATLAQFAPTGTPLATVARQFYEKLPPSEQAAFLSWWQHTHQQEPLTVPEQQRRPHITGPLPPLDTQQEQQPTSGFVARDPRQDLLK